MREIPGIPNLEPETLKRIDENASRVNVSAGSMVFEPGKSCENFLWLVSGQVRVQMIGRSGRQVTLYRIKPGQSCIMTTACIMSDEEYNAEAIVEEDAEALMIPRSLFLDLLGTSDAIRIAVFGSFGERMTTLMRFIEESTFTRLDHRLAQIILGLQTDGKVKTTHEALSQELGTHREVVSRQLKEWERAGIVALGHGAIDILKPAQLSAIFED